MAVLSMAITVAGQLAGSCWRLALSTVLLIAVTAGRSLAEDITAVNVQAATQTLRFVNSLQHRTSLTIGVVFRKGDTESEALAQRVPAMFAGRSGPNLSVIAANAVAANELAQTARRFDVLYMLPGLSGASHFVAEYVRREHVPSISSDPECLETRCCVLMVSGADGNIVLDVGLAKDADTKFAAVFTMMVRRR